MAQCAGLGCWQSAVVHPPSVVGLACVWSAYPFVMPFKDQTKQREFDKRRSRFRWTTMSESQKGKARTRSRKYRLLNGQKINEQQRDRRASNPEQYRVYDARRAPRKKDSAAAWKSKLKVKYGLTQQQWDALFESQGRKCAICGVAEPNGHGRWCTDHIHGTRIVRGILCHRCNVILHKDLTVGVLENMIRYLSSNVRHG